MDRKERFYATIERKPVDRPASWLGLPVPQAMPGLYRQFRVNTYDELKEKIGDDIYPVDVPFNCPPMNHIACAFDFAQKGVSSNEERTLTAPGFFENFTDPTRIDEFLWPSPEKFMSTVECKMAVENAPEDYALMGILWSAHFQDACAAFGMENAMMTMLMAPDMFDIVIDKVLDFYLKANEIFYEAAGNKLDAVLIGNDWGSQSGLMLSPELLHKHVYRGTRKLIEQAHSYGYKVIHHSCGSIAEIIPDLVDLGADAIHPIQALAAGMSAKELKEKFDGKVSFCGGVDAQELLVNGNPEEVSKKVMELKELFPTGLIISPSHEAILPDISPENVEALFNSIL
ncbi:MAG: uroporphyrinogen decarboxylase family protein [Cytophagales bacterium]|nr:uroporphyrinogen decarboxylase family protein [Cytophagales bacterium]